VRPGELQTLTLRALDRWPAGLTLIEVDPDDPGASRILWTNDTGSTEGELDARDGVGRTVREAFQLDEHLVAMDHLAKAVATGEVQEHTLCYPSISGKPPMIFGIRIIPIGGNVIMGEFRNLSRRAEVEAELLENERHYREMFENAPISLWEEDASDLVAELRRRPPGETIASLEDDAYVRVLGSLLKIERVNAASCRMFQADEETLKKRLFETFTPEAVEVFRAILRSLVRGELWFEGECEFVRLGGTRFRARLGSRTSRTTSGYTSWVYIQDVTREHDAHRALTRQAEELRASNRELERFASIVSHDLQEPLRMVESFLALLESDLRDDLGPDGRERMGYVRSGARRMREMVDALLRYSRVTREVRPHEPVSLEEVIDAAWRNLALAASDASATLDVRPMPRVFGDPAQLQQLLQNLLGNSIKFRGEEPPHVVVRAVNDGEMVRLEVEDNGIGIDPERADEVFEIFRRLDSDRDGTGIGLAVAQRIVALHGGAIRAHGTPGHGTRIELTLRRAR